MSLSLDELLKRRTPILYDGATGTFLQELGLPIRTAPESWVLENPAGIFAAAQAYVNAGSQIILTCTFGGTAYRLLVAGLDAHAYEINLHAAELAREAAAGKALVAGSMGPLGQLALAVGGITYDDAVEQFWAQARALVDGGVDLFQIESMSDIEEVRAAVEGARRAADLPIFVTMSFETGGRTLMGLTPILAARDLSVLGVDAIGANCGSGPENMATLLTDMRSAVPHIPLIAKPNAGLPTVAAGQAVYTMEVERFTFYAREWVTAGARFIGGCCGTSPRFIEAIRRDWQRRRR